MRRRRLKRIADSLLEIGMVTGLLSLLVIFTEAPLFVRIIGWIAIGVTCILLGAMLYIQQKI